MMLEKTCFSTSLFQFSRWSFLVKNFVSRTTSVLGFSCCGNSYLIQPSKIGEKRFDLEICQFSLAPSELFKIFMSTAYILMKYTF